MSPSAGHRGRLRRLLVILTTGILLATVPGGVAATGPRKSDAERYEEIVEKIRGEHGHSDGSSHRHGGMAALTAADLAFLDLRRGSGACSGMYEEADDTPGDACTHGLDVPLTAEATAAVVAGCGSFDISTCPPPAGWAIPTRIPCYSTGPFTQVLYLYWGTSRLPAYREKIRRSVASIDLLFKISASPVKNSSGARGNRHVRWAMTAGCKLKVTAVKLPTSVSGSIYAVKRNLVSRGIIKSTSKYLGYVDRGSCAGGIAEVPQSTIAGSTNRSNRGGTLGLVYGDCFNSFHPYGGFGATIAAHELMHTLGAVQDNAPHSTGGHCWDDGADAHLGADIMCYADGGVPNRKFYQRCAQTYPETFDCGKDDYYNPYPRAGSYLQKYWNPARNRFLSTGEPPAWDLIRKPSVVFTKPSISGGTVGGDAPAVVQIRTGGLAIASVAWTVNGARVPGTSATLALQTPRTRTGGFANGVELTLGATVTDEGFLKGKASTKAIVANPWIRLTAPSAWADTSGATGWSAAALAYGGKTVAKVELLVDGQVAATDTTSPYGGTFTPVLPLDGSTLYEVAARVTDSAGITRTTPARLINRPAPTIVWRAPASDWDGWTSDYAFPALAGSTLKIVLDATTIAPGGIDRVVFRVNGAIASTDPSAPYAFEYVVPPSGSAQITAQAFDQHGIYETTPNGIWVGATSAPGTFAFTAPATDDGTVTGSTPFTLAVTVPVGSEYDTACLHIDLAYASCMDPRTEDTVSFDVSVLRPGTHVAHWELYGASGTVPLSFRGPFRRFVVAGTDPSIAITQITLGQQVGGNQAIGAVVSDLPSGVAVYAVHFFEGGNPVGSDYQAPYDLTWDTRTFGDGARTIRAVADLSDGSTVRAALDVEVVNATANLTAPAAGLGVSGIVTVAGTGSYDAETALETASFYVDGTLITTDRFAPFSATWDTTKVVDGVHSLTMRLILSDGRSITTNPTSVTVDNP